MKDAADYVVGGVKDISTASRLFLIVFPQHYLMYKLAHLREEK